MKILLTIYHYVTHYVEELLYLIAKRDMNNQKNVIRWGKFCIHRVNIEMQITSLICNRIDNRLSRLKREEGV